MNTISWKTNSTDKLDGYYLVTKRSKTNPENLIVEFSEYITGNPTAELLAWTKTYDIEPNLSSSDISWKFGKPSKTGAYLTIERLAQNKDVQYCISTFFDADKDEWITGDSEIIAWADFSSDIIPYVPESKFSNEVGYILQTLQLDIYNELMNYLIKNGLNIDDENLPNILNISKRQLKQIISGDCNLKLEELVALLNKFGKKLEII